MFLKLTPILVALSIVVPNASVFGEDAPNALFEETTLSGTPTSVTVTTPSVQYVVFEASTSSRDTRPLTALFEAPEGAVAYVQTYQVSKVGHSERTKSFRPWRVNLVGEDGSESSVIRGTVIVNETGHLIGYGTGLLHIDACARRSETVIQLVIDLSGVINRSDSFTVNGALFLKSSPQSQQTLLKYPSEKSSSQAVLIMRRSLSGTVVSMVRWRNGRPRKATIFRDPGLYIAQAMPFTRLYIPRAKLSGEFVTIEAHENSFGGSYGVCAQLAPRRQELEGYHR